MSRKTVSLAVPSGTRPTAAHRTARLRHEFRSDVIDVHGSGWADAPPEPRDSEEAGTGAPLVTLAPYPSRLRCRRPGQAGLLGVEQPAAPRQEPPLASTLKRCQ